MTFITCVLQARRKDMEKNSVVCGQRRRLPVSAGSRERSILVFFDAGVPCVYATMGGCAVAGFQVWGVLDGLTPSGYALL
jgi:hypothetical protein